jgi:hypothetical protein
MGVVAGSLAYFVWSMVAGFIVGAVRELIFIPALGFTVGNLLEAVFMLVAIWVGAFITTKWCRVPPRWRDRISMGVYSPVLVLAAEVGFSPFVHGSVSAWLAKFTPLTSAITVALWAAQAAAPTLARANHDS